MSEDQKVLIEAWKTTIQVQQHFNDIELRIRNFALTALVAVLGGSSLALKEDLQIEFCRTLIPAGALILMAGLIGWGGFYFIDRHWYHRLLRGAVIHGTTIEAAVIKKFPELGLTHQISESSRIPLSRKSAVLAYIGLEIAVLSVFTFFYRSKGLMAPGMMSLYVMQACTLMLIGAVWVYWRMPRKGVRVTAAHRIDVFYLSGGLIIGLLLYGQISAVNKSDKVRNISNPDIRTRGGVNKEELRRQSL